MQNSNRIALKSFFPYFSILLFFFVSCSPFSNERTVRSLEIELANLSKIPDSAQRKAQVDSLWAELKLNNQIPFTQDNVAIFLYNGSAEQVNWNGDFNSWSSNKKYPNQGKNIEGTDIWMLKTHFPANARLDYKITVDGDWILDPENSNTQWSGYGPNSELRMPKWEPEPLKARSPETAQGTLSNNKIITSSEFGYTIQYQVYTPPNYAELGDLPVLYVTDGHEYSDDQLGSSIVVLDNLLHQKKIKPIIVVFVDPRNPDDVAINRRSDQFAVNEKYLAFFTETLIPEIESKYNVQQDAKQRGILGTSFGGLNATYFGFTRPDVFGKVAIQAPSFWYREEIYDIVRNSTETPNEVYMSVGTIGDNLNDAQRMKTLFEQRKVHFTYLQINEGHSWGAWSAQMDDIFLQFFGK